MKRSRQVGLLILTVAAVLVGTRVLGVGDARAQSAGYRECFFAQQECVDIDNNGTVATPDSAHSIHVPPGWTVVSGAGNFGGGVILFCR